MKGLYIVYENEIYNKYYTKLVNDHGVILIGWTPKISFDEGLKETVSWYKNWYDTNGEVY